MTPWRDERKPHVIQPWWTGDRPYNDGSTYRRNSPPRARSPIRARSPPRRRSPLRPRSQDWPSNRHAEDWRKYDDRHPRTAGYREREPDNRDIVRPYINRVQRPRDQGRDLRPRDAGPWDRRQGDRSRGRVEDSRPWVGRGPHKHRAGSERRGHMEWWKRAHMKKQQRTAHRRSLFTRSHRPARRSQEAKETPSEGRGAYHAVLPPGKMLNEHFRVVEELGVGTFGVVVACEDERDGKRYAVKVVREGEDYQEAALIECEILKSISQADPERESGCIHLVDSFTYLEKHVCMVTEELGMSLYTFLSRNKFRGFCLSDVQTIARDLLKSLCFLKAIHLAHTDLKPENILLIDDTPLCVEKFRTPESEPVEHIVEKGEEKCWAFCMRPRSAHVKIVDFGGATFAENEHSSLINTRQYRAPEVILGLGWDESSDVWSLGCILAELYTGTLLFKTHDHLEHLHLMEKIIGKFPAHMLTGASASKSGGEYVTPHLETASRYDDLERQSGHVLASITQNVSRAHVNSSAPLEQAVGCSFTEFASLLRLMLVLDPKERCAPEDLLRHEFFNLTLRPDGDTSRRNSVSSRRQELSRADQGRREDDVRTPYTDNKITRDSSRTIKRESIAEHSQPTRFGGERQNYDDRRLEQPMGDRETGGIQRDRYNANRRPGHPYNYRRTSPYGDSSAHT